MPRTKKNKEAEAYQLEHYGVIITRHIKNNGEIMTPYYSNESTVRDCEKMLTEIVEQQAVKLKTLKGVLARYRNEVRRYDEHAKEVRRGYLRQATIEELEAALAEVKKKKQANTK